MKKKIFTQIEIDEIIRLYTNELLGSHTISIKTGIGKAQILSLLKEKNIPLRKSGRTNLGGKKESSKRYDNKPEIKERKKQISKEWSSKNREHLREYHRKWRENNIIQLRKTRNYYEKTRKSNDPIYKLIGNFRTAIYTVLKENNLTKCGHYFEILGYSQQDLVNHLDKQLKDGMTWKNYGEWHVDHKLPITSFNFKDIYDEEFKKCWSLDNLQPMWGEENIYKSNKIL